jgi:hypothetical protein
MMNVVTQLLARCDFLRLSFDLLVFPAGTLNYYGSEASPALVLGTEEVSRILGTLRRARRTVSSIVFGVDVWSYPEERAEALSLTEARGQRLAEPGGHRFASAGGGPRLAEPGTSRIPEPGTSRIPESGAPRIPEPGAPRIPEPGVGSPLAGNGGGPQTAEAGRAVGLEPGPEATWQYLVAADVGGLPAVYQKRRPSPDEGSILRGDDGSSRLVQLAGRRVRLSMDEEQFDDGQALQPARREQDGADLWVNPIHINHPGGGASAGRWPVSRIETTLRDSTCPIFLPHYRRTRLEGPFWFAGHPDQARPHRWQPVEEVWFGCGNERVQLLTFDVL